MTDELVGNTEFGRQVIAARDQTPYPTTVEGVPLNDFLLEERRRADEGLPSQMFNDDGTPFVSGQSNDRPAPTSRQQLFQEEAEQFLFDGPQPNRRGRIDSTVATNRAYMETLINDDPNSLVERAERLQNATVQDAAVELTRKLIAEQDLAASGFLQPDVFDSLSPADQITRLTETIIRLDMRELTPLNFALMETFLQGGGKVRMSTFEAHSRQINASALRQRSDYRSRVARRKAEQEVMEVVAAQSFDGYLDMAGQVTVQDMTPGWPLLSRLGVLNGLADSAGIEIEGGWKGLFLGEIRQDIREGLISMSPEEFLEAARAMKEQIRMWEADPVKGPLVTRYNLLEQFEAVFTEDVYDGASAKNTGDRWFGNFETVLETLFSVVVVAKAGKSVLRTMRAADNISARTVALASDAPEVAARIDDMVQADELAVQLGLEADEAATQLLPRPASMVNDVENLPDGSKAVLERSDRVRSEILESTDKITGEGLTKVDRTNTVNAEISALDFHDGAHVQGRMSTLQMMENNTGFKMRVVVGETAEGGWASIDDVMAEALDIDPLLEHVSIMRIGPNGVLEEVFESSEAFARAVTKGEVNAATAGRIAGGDSVDNSFYLTYDRDRFWHTIDKEAFTGETFLSGGIVPRAVLAPNAKFGDEIYGSFLRSYMNEQALLKNFEVLFEPFYKMGAADKKFVSSAFEWMEDFGKQNGRAPDLSDIYARYDGLTETQLNGMLALREGMDTLHELFNRRLYRDWQALGYNTARPANTALPAYHGNVLDRGTVGRGMVYDPETGKMIQLTSRELDDLYNAGGRVMELDMAVDALNETRHKATRILLRDGTYEVGDLSTKPLIYHPGYSMRFYDDPYYVVKDTEGIRLNGSQRAGATSRSTDAIRTAGTQAEAEAFARRAQRSDTERGVQGTTWRVVRANDINQSESTLFQKQSIHREGRLFWDNRNFDRLPDVNGSRATLEDPVKSLERGIGQAARQLTHEDVLKRVKAAWKNDYGDTLPPELLERFDLGEISRRLKADIGNTVDKAAKQRLRGARELIDYLRLMEGTESAIIPKLREAALSVATTVNRMTGLKSKRLEQLAQTMDPFKTMRSIAFNAFMVFRPLRQALLQSAQISYLAALRPSYVSTPQFFRDAIALRRGIAALRKTGYNDGFSVKQMAKSMGLSEKEYRVLIREFDRSGLIDLVDVHSFAGGASRFRKTALPVNDSPLGTIGYKGRQFGRATRDWFQKIGFNFGERNNLTFTYNLALKRMLERKEYDSLLRMSKQDWEDLRVEASNLGLGMVRPNSFGYQTGALGVATQFLGFSHKAALGLLGANPAIKGRDALKILFGTYLLYGANMYGARDAADEHLKSIGVSDREIPGAGFTLVDLISAGIIDTTFNMLGDMTAEDWKDVDLGFLAPGVDFTRLWEMQLETLMEQPTKAIFGAFGNVASRMMQSYEFVSFVHAGFPDMDPVDKFTISANAMLSGALPQYNDVVQAYLGYQMNQWYSQSKETMGLRPTMNTLLARSLFGVRSREELGYYRLQNKIWEDGEAYQNIVQENKKYLARLVTELGNGVLTTDQVHQQIGAMANLWEEWPEGVRLQMMKDSMEFKQNDGVDKNIYQMLIDTLKDRRFEADKLTALVDRFTDIPTEQREQLKLLVIEAHESRVNVDAQALEELQREQE